MEEHSQQQDFVIPAKQATLQGRNELPLLLLLPTPA